MSTPVPPPPPSDGDSGNASPTPPPPPPNYGTAPPGPPQYDQQYGQPQYGAPAPGYGPAPGFEEKPPRPDVKVGAGLIVAGAIVTIIGIYLPWLTGGGDSRNGTSFFITSDLTTIDGPGNLMLVLALIVLGLGIALFFAGRVLAVAIIAIVMAVITEFMGLGMIGIASDDVAGQDLGIGVILQPIAPLAALAGAIVCTAKRRRPTTP